MILLKLWQFSDYPKIKTLETITEDSSNRLYVIWIRIICLSYSIVSTNCIWLMNKNKGRNWDCERDKHTKKHLCLGYYCDRLCMYEVDFCFPLSLLFLWENFLLQFWSNERNFPLIFKHILFYEFFPLIFIHLHLNSFNSAKHLMLQGSIMKWC